MGTVPVGSVIEIWSTDPVTKTDIGAWSAKVGHEFLGVLDGRRLRPRLRPPRQVEPNDPSGAGRATRLPRHPAPRSRSIDPMTAAATMATSTGRDLRPEILVFSTNNISDPGIDLAGSSHMHYSPGVMVISLPCTSGIRPSWILACDRSRVRRRVHRLGRRRVRLSPRLRQARVAIMAGAQAMLRHEGHDAAAPADGGDLLGLRRAVHEARQAVRGGARSSSARAASEVMTRWTTTSWSSAAASAAWNPPSSSATWATRSCSSRRRPASAGR